MINDSSKKYYFEVSAKCGHVGRTYYYLGIFYVQAPDGKTAASIVRNMPRVKHHHKDAILSVTRIGYEEYQKGRAMLQKDPYFICHNKREQKMVTDIISKNIFLEPQKERIENIDRKCKLEKLRRQYRKLDKYGYYQMGVLHEKL